MDELWQRYRSFLTPALIGLGVFLVGLIAVHVLTDDPDTWRAKVRSEGNRVKTKVVPLPAKVSTVRRNRDRLAENVKDWSLRLDQAGGNDPLERAVADALRASILRGADPLWLADAIADPAAKARDPSPDEPKGRPSSRDVLEPFDGDDTAARLALQRYEDIRLKRLNLLETGDPNVGFVRLLEDVSSELRVRANRADVEFRTEAVGFSGVTSVSRAVLAQRLLNLARIAELLDLAIRSGVRAVTEIRLDTRTNPLGDDVFLREWPFHLSVMGDTPSLRPILAWLTDEDRPIPITHLLLSQPPRTSPLDGVALLQVRAASILVRPDADLSLELEDM